MNGQNRCKYTFLNFDTITDLASTKLNVNFFSASIPANVEYDISGKEFYDHFSRTNGCHFTFYDEEGYIEKLQNESTTTTYNRYILAIVHVQINACIN